MYKSECKCGHSHTVYKLSTNPSYYSTIKSTGEIRQICNSEWNCKCKQYIPSNNLEYLEWLYEQHNNV